jgi:GNAT superfamily N-acetyltransferase
MTLDDIDHISERIEREMLASLSACCPADTRDRLGLVALQVADGIALSATRDASILLNRCTGLGADEELKVGDIERVATSYAERGIGRYYLQLYEDDLSSDCRHALARNGLERARAWMKFKRDTGVPPAARSDLRVERVTGAQSRDFAMVACTGFELSDAAIPLLAALVDDDRWSLLVSYDGDEPAGSGALFVDGEAAWLDWAATRPEFRRRGSQSALMAVRLEQAIELGARHIFTETGEAVEGDPQHSYRNILKAGFEEARLRANYTPATGRA